MGLLFALSLKVLYQKTNQAMIKLKSATFELHMKLREAAKKMAADSRLPRYSYGFFLLSPPFQTHLCNNFKQAVGPSVLLFQYTQK